MNCSLNETEFLAKKAARGGGYPWGVAEEVGRATRWLAQQGLDGCAVLLAVLTCLAEDEGRTKWQCPIAAGIAFSDAAYRYSQREEPQAVQSVFEPLMMVPFIGNAARQIGRPLYMAWDVGRLVTDGQFLTMRGAIGSTMNTGHDVEIGVGALEGVSNPFSTRAHPDVATWEQLTEFADKTYAPASEQSRLKGAGAGLSDND